MKSNHEINLNGRFRNEIKRITNITDITMDRQGRVWIGTYSQGVFIINPSDFKVRSFHENDLNEPINTIYEDSRSNIWFVMIKYSDSSNARITGTYIPVQASAWRCVKKSWRVTEERSGLNRKVKERDARFSLQYRLKRLNPITQLICDTHIKRQRNAT